VANLPKTAADKLIEKQCWSLPSITFFVIPYNSPAYPFICNIENLSFMEHENDLVLKLIKETIWSSDRARTSVTRYNPNLNAFDQILDSMYIKPLSIGIPLLTGGGSKLTWNLYATPPSQNPTRNNKWRHAISSLTFIMTFKGASSANKTMGHCSGCRSMDHPRGLCPFPLLDDWFDPPPTNTARPPIQRGRGPNRGNGWKPGCGRARNAMSEGPFSLNY
jgi:hypothetical protein